MNVMRFIRETWFSAPIAWVIGFTFGIGVALILDMWL